MTEELVNAMKEELMTELKCHCQPCTDDGPHLSDCIVHGTGTELHGIIYAQNFNCTCGRYLSNRLANLVPYDEEGEIARMKKEAEWYHNASFGEIAGALQAVYVRGYKTYKARLEEKLKEV